jgi:hypothetical protein
MVRPSKGLRLAPASDSTLSYPFGCLVGWLVDRLHSCLEKVEERGDGDGVRAVRGNKYLAWAGVVLKRTGSGLVWPSGRIVTVDA